MLQAVERQQPMARASEFTRHSAPHSALHVNGTRSSPTNPQVFSPDCRWKRALAWGVGAGGCWSSRWPTRAGASPVSTGDVGLNRSVPAICE